MGIFFIFTNCNLLKRKTLLKSISLFLVGCFLFQEISFANPDSRPIQWNVESKASLKWAKEFLPDIPESIATIEDAWKGGQRAIILIQDAHTNNSGQINGSKTLNLILKQNKNIKFVFSEAAVGENNLSFLRAYASLEKRKRIAKSYLQRGLLHGVEYLDLTTDYHFVLWGVEDPKLYIQSVETYASVAKNREKFQDYLKKVEATVKTLKPRIYNPFLLSFDEKYQRYQKEETSLTNYFEILTSQAQRLNLSLQDFPHLRALSKLRELEQKIDFKKANEEQQKAIESLSPEDQKELSLTQKENDSLFKLSVNENKTQKAFFALLAEKLSKRHPERSERSNAEILWQKAPQNDGHLLYPELSKYFTYLKEAKKINPKEFLKEHKLLEREVFKALTTNSDEEYLIRVSLNLDYLRKLLSLTLSPDEFKEYQAQKQSFEITKMTGFLNKKIMDLRQYYENTVFLESGYEDVIKKCEEFYELTYERDKRFVENLTKKMDEENQEKAILITGGYHSPNLKYLLKEQGISYISITPQVLHETNLKRYEAILLSQDVQKTKNLLAVNSNSQGMPNFNMTTYVKGRELPASEEAVRILTDVGDPQAVSLGAASLLMGARMAVKKQAITEEENFLDTHRAAVQKLWLDQIIYPEDHPASQYLSEKLKHIDIHHKARIFLIHDDEENAFATASGEIYITTGMLKFLDTEEELSALLMHELRHIEKKHLFREWGAGYDLLRLGQRRLAEWEADIAMFFELDERGINPIGALHLPQKLRDLFKSKNANEAGKKSGKTWGKERLSPLDDFEDVDPEHGTPTQRYTNLRELIRIFDFRNLKDQTTPIDKKAFNLSKPRFGKTRLRGLASKPADFWRSFGQAVQNGSKNLWIGPAQEFIQNSHLGLDETEEVTLILTIHRLWIRSEEPLTIEIGGQSRTFNKDDHSLFSPEVVIKLVEEKIFEKLGLVLSREDLLSLSDAALKQAFQDLSDINLNQRIALLKKLRETILKTSEERFGFSNSFKIDWDTAFVHSFWTSQCLTGKADFDLMSVGKEADTKLLDFRGPIPLASPDPKRFSEVLKKMGVEEIRLVAMLEQFMAEIGFPMYEASFYVQDKHLGFINEFHNHLRDFVGIIKTHIEQNVLPKQRDSLASAHVYSTLVGFLEDFIVKGRGNSVGRISRFGVWLQAPKKDEIAQIKGYDPNALKVVILVALSESLSKGIINAASGKYDELLGLPLDQCHRFIQTEHKALSSNAQEAKSFRFFLKGLERYHNSKYQKYEDPDKLKIRDVDGFQRAIFINLYVFRSKRQFLNRVNYLVRHSDFPTFYKDVLEFFEWLRRTAAQRGQTGDGEAWNLGPEDFAQLATPQAMVKEQVLTGMKDMSPSEIFHSAIQCATEWGIAFVAMDSKRYDSLWSTVSEKINPYLTQEKNRPKTHQDFEKLLALSLFSQGSFPAMSLATISFREMMERSPDFNTAFSYLEKYGFLPRPLLQEGFRVLVEKKATKKEHFEKLNGWFRGQVDLLFGEAEKVLLADVAQILFRLIPQNRRLEFFKHLISTNATDEGLKKFMAEQWMRVILNRGLDVGNIHELTMFAYFGEKDRNAEKFNRGIQETSRGLLAIRKARIPFFEEFYTSLYRLDFIIVYLLLRSLTLEGNDAIFKSKEAKENLVDFFIEHYIRYNKSEASQRFIRHLKETLCQDLNPEDLFYFLGPTLTQMSFQLPLTPYGTEPLIDALLGKHLEGLKKDYPEIGDEKKFPETQKLLRARIKTFATGVVPGITGTSPGKVEVRFPEQASYANWESVALERLSDLVGQRQVFSQQVTPVELAVEVAKNVGALAVRLLQLSGMYFNLSPEDRLYLSQVYDAVKGQTKLQAYNTLKREAELNPKLRPLFEGILEIGEMVGGGSNVTVYDVRDKKGRWAIGVKNPNADYRSGELLKFANEIISGLLRRDPGNKAYGLLRLLLDDAYHWMLDELNDPEYIQKNQAFHEQNDHRSKKKSRFKPINNVGKKVFIPSIEDTGTDWVRWEEFIEGVSLNQLLEEVRKGQTDGSLSPAKLEEARKAVALITQNFLYQLFETGLVHSDIHPGQFIQMKENREAILDRKNLLEFGEEERRLLVQIIKNSYFSNRESVFDSITDHFLDKKQKKNKKFMTHLNNFVFHETSFEEPEQSLVTILSRLKEEGIPVPLKWILLMKNFVALNRLNRDVGFDNFLYGLVYSPDEAITPFSLLKLPQALRELLPTTDLALGGARLSEQAQPIISNDTKNLSSRSLTIGEDAATSRPPTAVRLAETPGSSKPALAETETFLAKVAKLLLPDRSKKKLALGLHVYEMERNGTKVIVEGLYEEPVVIDIEKAAILGKAPSDFKTTSTFSPDLTDQLLKLIEANKKGRVANSVATSFVQYLHLDGFLSGLPKNDKAKLRNLLKHINQNAIVVLEGSEESKRLVYFIISEERVKNPGRFVTMLPQEYAKEEAIHLIQKDFYLNPGAELKQNLETAYSDQNLHHWLVLDNDTESGQQGAFAFGTIEAIAQRVAIGDLKGAYDLFRELYATSHEGAQSEPQFSDFLEFLKGNKDKVKRFAIRPILTKSLQEAYRLYQLEQAVRVSA